MPVIHLFAPVLLELQEELLHPAHLDLREGMANCEHNDMPSRVGHLAGLLGVAVSGAVGQTELEGLAEMLVAKMRDRRAAILKLVN